MNLFTAFRTQPKLAIVKRVLKTPGALYRTLSREFERSRTCSCSCRVPMVVEREPEAPGEANWSVETLWWGCDKCRTALAEIVRRNGRLFDMKKLPAADAKSMQPPDEEARVA